MTFIRLPIILFHMSNMCCVILRDVSTVAWNISVFHPLLSKYYVLFNMLLFLGFNSSHIENFHRDLISLSYLFQEEISFSWLSRAQIMQ